MMYIGAIFGGPEAMSSEVGSAISKIKRLVGEHDPLDSGSGVSASLDVVFHVPGSLVTPEYEGVRAGRLSKKERLLQVQIAVPQDVIRKDRDEIERSLIGLLREAVRRARPIFERAQIPYPHEEYERIVDIIERRYSPN
jgi:hypothetical protein